MNSNCNEVPVVKMEEGPFKEMMIAVRELVTILNKDEELNNEEIKTLSNYRKTIINSIFDLKKISQPETKEEMFTDIVEKIIKFLDKEGYTPDAYYRYQLEYGTLA